MKYSLLGLVLLGCGKINVDVSQRFNEAWMIKEPMEPEIIYEESVPFVGNFGVYRSDRECLTNSVFVENPVNYCTPRDVLLKLEYNLVVCEDVVKKLDEEKKFCIRRSGNVGKRNWRKI